MMKDFFFLARSLHVDKYFKFFNFIDIGMLSAWKFGAFHWSPTLLLLAACIIRLIV